MKPKTLLLLSMAAFIFCGGCDDNDDEPIPAPIEDAISILPEKSAIGSKGGDIPVLVTSSGKWTLTGEANNYVHPGSTEGKDGDIVTFHIQPNDQQKDLTFNYTFACGKKKAPYTIVLKKKTAETEEVFELTYVEGANIISSTGGKVTVLVTSSQPWTLSGTYPFSHPSITNGGDGDEVVFTVDPNTESEEQTAEYIFKMGDKEQPFTITLKAGGEPPYVRITSEKELTLDYPEQSRVAVNVETNIPYETLIAHIESDEEGWLTSPMTTEGATEREAVVYFELTQNKGLEARNATVRIAGPDGGEDQLTIVQKAQRQLLIEEKEFYIDLPGTELKIPVVTNVDLDVTVSQSGSGWCTYTERYEEGAFIFSIQPLESGKRTCEVTLTEKNAPAETEPLTETITIIQKPEEILTVEPGTPITFDYTNCDPVELTVTMQHIDGDWTYQVPDWIDAEKNENKLTVTAQNNTGLERTGQIIIKAGRKTVEIDVSQKAAEPAIIVDTEQIMITKNGTILTGTVSRTVTLVNISEDWEFTKTSWIMATRSGNSIVVTGAWANTLGFPRSGEVVISAGGKSVKIPVLQTASDW